MWSKLIKRGAVRHFHFIFTTMRLYSDTKRLSVADSRNKQRLDSKLLFHIFFLAVSLVLLPKRYWRLLNISYRHRITTEAHAQLWSHLKNFSPSLYSTSRDCKVISLEKCWSKRGAKKKTKMDRHELLIIIDGSWRRYFDRNLGPEPSLEHLNITMVDHPAW